MPFDSVIPASSVDLAAAERLRVRAALAGWRPRPIEASPRVSWLVALRAAFALLRRPLSDKGLGLCY